MDIDRLLAEADPARSISIPGPESPEARQALGQLTKTAPRPSRRGPLGRPRRPVLAGGGPRRAGRRRIRLLVSVAAVTCAAVATGLVVAAQVGAGPAVTPVAVSPPALSPLPSAARSRAGLRAAAWVGQAMLTAYDAASGDIVYTRQIGAVHGKVAFEYRLWDWPAQPVPGQQARERDVYAQRTRAFGDALTLFADYGVAYSSPAPGTRSEIFHLTMVCYPGNRGCGWGPARAAPAGTWSRVSFRSGPIATDIGPGDDLNPAAIASEIVAGQWRVVGRTRLDGQPAIELRETRSGSLLPLGPVTVPGLLWVNARTHLPIRWITGVGTAWVDQQDYVYLPPTPANLALLRVPIPRGYPRSNPFPG